MPCLANALKNLNDFLEISHVEDGKNEPDMPEMTVACLQIFPTSLAFLLFARNSHALVEGPIIGNRATFVEVEESAVDEFDIRLIYDILIRPVTIRITFVVRQDTSYKTPKCSSLMTFGTSFTTCSFLSTISSVSGAPAILAVTVEHEVGARELGGDQASVRLEVDDRMPRSCG